MNLLSALDDAKVRLGVMDRTRVPVSYEREVVVLDDGRGAVTIRVMGRNGDIAAECIHKVEPA